MSKSTKNSQSTRIMFIKNRVDDLKLEEESHLPGPSNYDSISAHQKTQSKTPSYSFSNQDRKISHKHLFKMNQTPGPAAYLTQDPNLVGRQAPRAKFEMKGKATLDQHLSNPGVGSYNIGKVITSGHKLQPKFSFNRDPKESSKLVNQPGPSTYKPIFVKLRRNPKATIGAASRVGVNVKIEKGGKLYALRSTHQIAKHEQNPGPAAYNFTPTIGAAPTYTKVGI